jgi:hypothetical protein
MADKPKQAEFFIQDPFTEQVKGPLSVQQLKQWFAKGGVEEWGVSKSPNGPWTPARTVKGIAPPPSPPAKPAAPPPSAGVAPRTSVASSSSPSRNEESSDSWGALIGDVFAAVMAKRSDSEGQGASRKLLLGGTALGGVALALMALVGIVYAASSGLGSSLPSELRQNSSEADGAYRNRIAKDVFAGAWESETDNNDIVMPDGSKGGIQKERMLFSFQPSQTSHGMLQTMYTDDSGRLTDGTVCYTWEIINVASGFFGGTTARFRYYPTECPNAPEYGTPSYELMRMRLQSEQAKDRPLFDFVLKDKDTLIQKNASPLGGPHISFGDQVWRRVR